jgi:DNA-binding response OmpR family regulator
LILGYGFSLPENPDDTLALKLGIPAHTLTPTVRAALSRLPSATPTPPLDRTWYIPRSGDLPADLFDIVRIVLSVQGPQSAEEEAELEMDVAGLLLEMVQTKLERLNELLERNEEIVERDEVRTEVWDMVQDYVQGEYLALEGYACCG